MIAIAFLLAVAMAARQPDETTCVITRVIDGDTIECESRRRVRLIGIDAPERAQKPFGASAAARLEQWIRPGSVARLEYDVTRADRYRRTLAYVWRDSTLMNEQIVAAGWAVAADYPPNTRHSARLHRADSVARATRVGMWANGGPACLPIDFRRKRCPAPGRR